MPRRREAQDRHNERRRQFTGKARQAVFTMEYIQMKYPEIYNEAEGFFTILDLRYPDKHDLRKTNEYASFKHITEGKASKDGKKLYFDIETAKVSVRNIENPSVTSAHSESQPMEICHYETVETVTSVPCESPSTETISSTKKELEPRLEITLIPEQQARKATVTTQTLQITTEQETPPISFNDIPNDMIDEIIAQLRQDPDLADIFNDF